MSSRQMEQRSARADCESKAINIRKIGEREFCTITGSKTFRLRLHNNHSNRRKQQSKPCAPQTYRDPVGDTGLICTNFENSFRLQDGQKARQVYLHETKFQK